MKYQLWEVLRDRLMGQGATEIYPADERTPHRVTARVYRTLGDGRVQVRELEESPDRTAWRPCYRWSTIQGMPLEARPIADAEVIECVPGSERERRRTPRSQL